jgi:hypothetical protein
MNTSFVCPMFQIAKDTRYTIPIQTLQSAEQTQIINQQRAATASILWSSFPHGYHPGCSGLHSLLCGRDVHLRNENERLVPETLDVGEGVNCENEVGVMEDFTGY